MTNLQLLNKWAKASGYTFRIGMAVFMVQSSNNRYSASIELFNKLNNYELHEELIKIGKIMEGIL